MSKVFVEVNNFIYAYDKHIGEVYNVSLTAVPDYVEQYALTKSDLVKRIETKEIKDEHI